MSEVRLKAWLEAMRGDTVTIAQTRRVGANLYAITRNPNPALTNDEKAAAVLADWRVRARVHAGDGAAAIEAAKQTQANIDAINAAIAVAMGDV